MTAGAMHDWEADPRPLGECLKARAAARGLTRDEAAAEMRIPRGSYDQMCSGRPVDREATIRLLMTLLDRAAVSA